MIVLETCVSYYLILFVPDDGCSRNMCVVLSDFVRTWWCYSRNVCRTIWFCSYLMMIILETCVSYYLILFVPDDDYSRNMCVMPAEADIHNWKYFFGIRFGQQQILRGYCALEDTILLGHIIDTVITHFTWLTLMGDRAEHSLMLYMYMYIDISIDWLIVLHKGAVIFFMRRMTYKW